MDNARKEALEENLWCLIGGMVLAIVFIALMLADDGERGLIDFF